MWPKVEAFANMCCVFVACDCIPPPLPPARLIFVVKGTILTYNLFLLRKCGQDKDYHKTRAGRDTRQGKEKTKDTTRVIVSDAQDYNNVTVNERAFYNYILNPNLKPSAFSTVLGAQVSSRLADQAVDTIIGISIK
jgi:hypothetical protein